MSCGGCKDNNDCPKACREMMLDLLESQKSGFIDGFLRIGMMTALCAGSAVLGVVLCKYVL